MTRGEKQSPPTSPAPITRRFDETNVARLGLISIQERIPPDFTSWTVKFSIDGRPATLSCVAPAEHGGIPHGLDNDVSMALIALYIEAGCPADGTFTTTAYHLLRNAGFDTNGHYYRVLRESLERLYAATYTASEAWRDHERQRWITVKFRYIDRLEYSTDEDGQNFDQRSLLRVSLPKEIVRSVRARYLKPLDLTFLATLERPHTRALYRLLDAQRHDPTDPTRRIVTYSANIIEWAQACKLVDRKPARIRRTLDPAHTELLERGYLTNVTYDGRGEQQRITYVFAEQFVEDADPSLITAIARYGVTIPAARRLIGEHGILHVRERLERFETLLARGYHPRSPGAVLVDVVRDDTGKYADPERFVRQHQENQTSKSETLTPTAAASERIPPRPDPQDAAREEEFRALPRTEQVNRAMATVQVMFGRRLDLLTLTRLRDALESGRLDPATLLAEATRAAMELRLEELATRLARNLEPGAEPGA